MNRNKLKTYAPQARREFIKAVTDRAAFYGLTADKIEPVAEQGDVAVIGGKAFPKSVAANRKLLEQRIARQGFEQVIEAMAYTWFNRFVAIRYMELHGYLDHGYRVLSVGSGQSSVGRGHSSAAGNATTDRGQLTTDNTPEILRYAEHVQLPGLDREEVIELKLEGNKEAELYDRLLLAQCHALHKAMPFLFEPIDDETELLLPDNLLHSDSLIRKLVAEIPADDWQEVEIIGWLYQFYISEKKDQVIGKVVKSEDIPAATQLFTPNWIVKYLVQNSLGRQWMATYPDSPLKSRMEYYIEPAEQTPEVQEQLKAITPTDLNPEELTLLDPACGSGHILVEAYDLLKAIYQERGYRSRDIPRLILEKNLYGLEIDDRAAQLAAFALMMKARADDRRIFDADVQPNVLAIQDSKGLDAKEITEALNQPIFKGELPPPESLFEEIDDDKTPLFSCKNLSEPGHIPLADVAQLIELFEHGKTFGSLIQVPENLAEGLPTIVQRFEDMLRHGGMLDQAAARSVKPLLEQARLLADKFDVVVTNPPYLNSQAMNASLKCFAESEYTDKKYDLFAMFVERNCQLALPTGHVGFMTPFVWMFISSFEPLRRYIIDRKCLLSLVHPEYHAFFDSAYVPICAFVLKNTTLNAEAEFFDLRQFYGAELQPEKFQEAIRHTHCSWRHRIPAMEFDKIPGSPLAYWTSQRFRDVFARSIQLNEITKPKAGMSTGNNEECIFFWWEVDISAIGFNQQRRSPQYRFYPHNKGGGFRRWYGNCLYILKYGDNDISRMESYPGFRHDNRDLYFREAVSWGKITSSLFSARYYPPGFTFDSAGLCLFFDKPTQYLALMNSTVFSHVLGSISNTLNYTVGDIGRTPIIQDVDTQKSCALAAIQLSKLDWDSSELSWEFLACPIRPARPQQLLADGLRYWIGECNDRIGQLLRLEAENNQQFIDLYGLGDELSAEVPETQITLYRPDREEDIKRLISYAIGCMMGRYSLDEPGLIYAHSGNQGFDPSRYKTFAADQDGIIPITDTDWFSDDAANRFAQFIATAWPKEHLEENLKFVAESLGPKKDESPRDTIRRYLSQGFFKHHLSMYKRRPIYWLFSSGKQRAFECLVYLHRYNEGTLSRMRTEYVIPLQGKIDARIEQLREDIASATSTAHGKRLQKERDKLIKQQAELRKFDEKLRHYADLRISLDLDDGVKVNYGKFGDLLAEVKAVTGTTAGE